MKVIKYVENEDGTATMQVDLTNNEAKMLIEVGLLKVLVDYSERVNLANEVKE